MVKKISFNNEKAIELLSSEELSSIAQKSKFTLFAEKFLLMSMSRVKIIMQALSKEHAKQQAFIFALFVLPFTFFLGIYICPHAFLDRLGASETLGKLAFLFCVNIIVGTSIKFLFKRKFFIFLALFFVEIFCYYFLPKSVYAFFLDSQMKRGFIFALTFSYISFSFLYVFWILIERVNSLLFSKILPNKLVTIGVEFTTSHRQELLEYFRKAMEEAAKAQEKDLELLVQSYGKNWDNELKKFLGPVSQKEEITPKSTGALPSSRDMIFPLYIGKKASGEDKWVDLDASPHILAAGTTGSGKSNFVEGYICSRLEEGECTIHIIDPSDDLYGYASNENVNYVTSVEAARDVVKNVCNEIEKRAALFKRKRGVRKISQWKGSDKPKRIFVVFDEFASFSNDERLIAHIIKIVRLGRKYGIHLLLATQSPRADIFKGTIKDNITTKVAFYASTVAHASVLGEPMARYIKESQKGLAVIGSEFVQTPLTDNRRWWDEDAEVEDDTVLGLPQTMAFLPAQKGDEEVQFLSKEALEIEIGGEPEAFGFEKVRAQIDGKYKRGYWVKKNVNDHLTKGEEKAVFLG